MFIVFKGYEEQGVKFLVPMAKRWYLLPVSGGLSARKMLSGFSINMF